MNYHSGVIIPRDYQDIAVNSVWDYFMQHTGNPIVAMPTGTGKSVVIALLVQRILAHWPNQRFLILTHVKELIEQNARKMQDLWPTAPIGIYSAGIGVRQTYMPITFGGIASVIKVLDAFPVPDLIIVDECHLISPDGDTMYQRLIAYFKERNPFVKVIGFTATWWRQGQGSLTDDSLQDPNHRKIFTDLAINMTDMLSFNWFLDEGYLVPLIPKRPGTQIDVSGVGITKGEYNLGQLQDATMKVTWGALKEAIEYAADRRKWLVFCAGKKNAEQAAEVLNSFGVPATFVHDGVGTKERDARITGFKQGYFRAICNNNILTTGFDDPGIDCIIVLRKTLSVGLWVQMLGRGTRPVYHHGYPLTTKEGRQAAIYYGGKRNCLVLDFARNTAELGPINDPRLPKRKTGGGGDAPVKICEKCGTYNHASVRYCVECGYEFPAHVKFDSSAAEDELIRIDAPEFVWFDVHSILYRKHLVKLGSKNAGTPVLKVTYQCKLPNGIQSQFFDEYIGFEHTGLMLHKAHMWWAARHLGECPKTVDEVLTVQHELRRPIKINVWTNKRYPEIMNYEYE